MCAASLFGELSMRHVYMILPPTVELLDMVGPLEVFRVARRFGADLGLHVVSPTAHIETSLPIQITGVTSLPTELAIADLVMIPGALDEDVDFCGEVAQAIVRFLKTVVNPKQHEVMSICSGAYLLGQAGLLDGRACTTHHALTDALQNKFPKALVQTNRVFVEDGTLYTSAGITAGIDLALHWLAKHYGEQITIQTASHMNLYFRRSSHDPELSPWLVGRNHMHRTIHKVQDTISANPTSPHALDDLAKLAFVSPRHLSRLFKQHTGMTVHDYQISLKHALFQQWRASGLSQEKAALNAGFSSAQAWRRSRVQHSL